MRDYLGALSGNWPLKLAAFALALVLWFAVQADKPYRYNMSVPVRVVNRDAEWVLTSAPSPASVRVEFSGAYRDLMRLRRSGAAVVVPVDQVLDSSMVRALQRGWVDIGNATNIAIGQLSPDSVRLAFDRIATRLVTVHAHFTGTVRSGFELAGPVVIDPPMVRASGPARRLARMDTLELPSIDVSSLESTDTTEVTVDTTGLGATISPRRVRVIVPIRRKDAAVPTLEQSQ